MDLLDLRYVSKAAEALNISRAAEIFWVERIDNKPPHYTS